MASPDLVIVSNRGPLSFTKDDEGRLVTTRGGGGLVSSLGPAVADTGATWVASAITEADREAAASGIVEAEGFRLHSLVTEPGAYRQFYEVVANATLWFLHHDLFDLPRRPRLDRHWRQAWDTFCDVNDAFAKAVADVAPEGGTVLVHDYHLSLLGDTLRRLRPDLHTAHFNHTPFCHPAALRVLPDHAARRLITGLAGHGACGFHSARWAESFEACCREMLVPPPRTFVAPAVSDLDALEAVAASEQCGRDLAWLEDQVADRRLIVRVDRVELSKNLLRGFLAFDELLHDHPEWRERVVLCACAYPSRDTLVDYLAYRLEVEALAERINTTWATPSWTPVVLDLSDSFARSVAALRRYDVLLVNPIRDGMNLVAQEGAAVNERDGVLVLSREAGAWDELGQAALGVNPFDVTATADALVQALTMEETERAERSAALRSVATRRSPQDWLADQVRAAAAPSGGPHPTGGTTGGG
ncbi:MAG: trehalose-6-phosphate synthase [Actinomycetota bacterium]|nr:trehalose-6-phosphate synthase [Actinomycetota bacterium]